MNHSVDSAEVYECTVVSDGLNFALELVADLNCFPELSLGSVLFSVENSLDRADCLEFLFVDLNDLELNCLLEE